MKKSIILYLFIYLIIDYIIQQINQLQNGYYRIILTLFKKKNT